MKEDLINTFPTPDADFIATPRQTTVLEPEISFSNTSVDADTWKWNYGDGDTFEGEEETHIFPSDSSGVYPVCLKALNANGCEDSICKDIVISGRSLVYVPNAFTPDGDGDNEKFYPVVQGVEPRNYNFFIFDRWGDLIFESDHPSEKWGGKIRDTGGKARPGVYVWKLVITLPGSDTDKTFTGHVTLIR